MSIRIYTDGSCQVKGGPGGWGFVATSKLYIDEEAKLGCGGAIHTTSNQMELMAILEAVRWASEHNHKDTCIFTDSMFCVNALRDMYKMARDGWRDKMAEKFIVKELYDTALSLNLQVQHIPGHSGDQFNTLADTLANNMMKQYSSNNTLLFEDVSAGDTIASRPAMSAFTNTFTVIGKYEASGTIILKPAYTRALKKDPFPVSEKLFNQSKYIKIIT